MIRGRHHETAGVSERTETLFVFLRRGCWIVWGLTHCRAARKTVRIDLEPTRAVETLPERVVRRDGIFRTSGPSLLRSNSVRVCGSKSQYVY